jgi:hypothetical protein
MSDSIILNIIRIYHDDTVHFEETYHDIRRMYFM